MQRALPRCGIRFCLAISLLAGTPSFASADEPKTAATTPDSSTAKLLLVPPRCYAVVGQELRIYYENVWARPGEARPQILVSNHNNPAQTKSGLMAFGENRDGYWSITPRIDQVGKHKLFVMAAASEGSIDQIVETELCVAPADAGAGKDVALLIVGDSLTNATLYPNEWSRLLSLPGNPKWKMLGTHKPTNAAVGVAHEGYGGWAWKTFIERYVAETDVQQKSRSSPFVFVGADGRPGLDVPRYIREACGERKPDVVTFLLGINDCFAAPADDPVALDRHIDGVFAYADRLLAGFHNAAPEARLAVCLTPPPNSRDGAFTANYKDRYPRSGWLKIQARLVERQLQHFKGREDKGIYIVPTNLDLDIVDGYPEDNAVHPNKAGYARIAASLHAWLKWQLYEDGLQR